MLRHLSAGAFLLLLLSAGATAHGQCEPSRPVREILDRAAMRHEMGLSKAERQARQDAILKEGLAAHPDDYFLLRTQIFSESIFSENYEQAASRRAAALHEKNPDRPVYALLHAETLAAIGSQDALRRVEALVALSPAPPLAARAHLVLANSLGYGKLRDKDRAHRELAAFLDLCPVPLDGNALRAVAYLGTAPEAARIATGLRQRLEADDDNPLLLRYWQDLWSLEFKARPVAEHAAVRAQIAADLARLEKSPRRHELDTLTLLRGGYFSAQDLAAVERIDEERLRDYPSSDVAMHLVQERWYKQHPRPRGGDKEQTLSFWRASLAAAEEWLRRWPDESSILMQRFDALASLPETTAEQIGAAADRLLAAYKRNPTFYRMPPVEYRVAEVLVKYKVHLDEVPPLVDEGNRAVVERLPTGGDLEDESTPKALAYMKLEKNRILLDYCQAAKQPERVRALLIEAPKPSEVTGSRWERPKNPLPPFSLVDLQGKSWKLVDLGGKALLINIWATWCGPCRLEHPDFQQLYDKLKARPDVAVLSFNVDDDLGKIAPYMKENHYSFPVLPAREVVDAVVPQLGIPRNWLVDPKGKLEWEQIGFGATPKWQEMILAKLEEVLKPVP